MWRDRVWEVCNDPACWQECQKHKAYKESAKEYFKHFDGPA